MPIFEKQYEIHERFYRNKNQTKGFIVYNPFELQTQHKDFLSQVISKINDCYQKCAIEHSMSFYQQPLDQGLLRDVLIALCLPILLAFIMGNTLYFLYVCLIDFGWIGSKIAKYCNKNDECRRSYGAANAELEKSFFRVRDEFQEQNPGLKIILHREWNPRGEVIQQYIEIIGKKALKFEDKQKNSPTTS